MAAPLASLGCSSRRPRWPGLRHGPRAQRLDRRAEAFTILEALIGVAILTASIGALAVVTAQQFSRSADVNVLDRLENAVARDVGWLKSYAKTWRLASGPYDLSCTQAGFASGCDVRVFSTTITDYQPDEARCATATGLAQDFINAAASVSITPARPFTIPTVASNGTSAVLIKGDSNGNPLNVAGLPSGTGLYRTIRISTALAERNVVYLSYSFEGPGTEAYRFVRDVVLRPEAAAWCP